MFCVALQLVCCVSLLGSACLWWFELWVGCWQCCWVGNTFSCCFLDYIWLFASLLVGMVLNILLFTIVLIVRVLFYVVYFWLVWLGWGGVWLILSCWFVIIEWRCLICLVICLVVDWCLGLVGVYVFVILQFGYLCCFVFVLVCGVWFWLVWCLVCGMLD